MEPSPSARVMAVDFGTRRIGIALSDESGVIAQPFCVIERKGTRKDVEKILEIVRKYSVRTIVAGVACGPDGNLTPSGEKGKAFGEELARRAVECGMPVGLAFIDESLTTVSAHDALSAAGCSGREGRKLVDKVAAAIILQDYLRTNRRS